MVSKSATRLVLLRLWGISNYPVEISYAVFETAWSRAEEKSKSTKGKKFRDLVYIEGQTLIELVEVCKSVYTRSTLRSIKVPGLMFNKLMGLDLTGTIGIVRGIMGREVVEWTYKLNPIRIEELDEVTISEELHGVKHADMTKMKPILKDYNYQSQENWADVELGYIGCYLGSMSG